MRRPIGEARAPRAGRLFQQDLLDEPFWMLAACSLVNLTTWDVAREALAWLRGRYVHPAVLAVAREEDLHEALRPLGLWRRRARSLIKLAMAYQAAPPRTSDDVLRLPGCGAYAAASWAIFQEGRTDVETRDGKLLWHLQSLRGVKQ